MMSIEKLIPRLARDCSANHGQLYPLLLDIFKVEKDFKWTVVTLIDPELEKVERFSDQIRMRLDQLHYNIKLANLILVELPNKNKVFPEKEIHYDGQKYAIVGVGVFEESTLGHWIAWIKNKTS